MIFLYLALLLIRCFSGKGRSISRNPRYLVGQGLGDGDESTLYAQFGHAGTKSTRFQAKEVCRTRCAFDSPACLFKNTNDVVFLNIIETFNRRSWVVDRLFKTIHYPQDISLTVDHRSLNQVS